MNKKNALMAMLGTVMTLAAVSTQAALINIPVTNPGAETGDLTGWNTTMTNYPDNDYSAVNNPAQSNSGSYYFGLNTGLIGLAGDQVGNYPVEYSMDSFPATDLSAYNGSLDELFLYSYARTGDLTLHVDWDNGLDGGTYEYLFTQSVGVWLMDMNGAIFQGLSYGTSGSNNWAEAGGNFSWWSGWDAQKDNIYGVSIFLDSGFNNFEYFEGPDLDTLDPNDPNITYDAYYTWTDANGISRDSLGDDLSQFPPVIGFDDVRLELTTVPVPAAVWLFGSGLIGLIGIARRKAA